MKKFKKIYIEITNYCNLNCSFCSLDNKEKREMSLEEFEYVLKQIDDYTDYLYLHVKGEPLLHSKFAQILNLCMKYHKKVNLTTNATLLAKNVDVIFNSSTRQINISLHSLINENLLDDIIKSADALSKNIQIVYRLWADNKLEKKIVDKLEKYYNKSLDGLNIKLKENTYLNKDKQFIWPSLNNEFISDKGKCCGLITHLGILVDGTVIPCCLDSSGIINLGNIFNEDFDMILNKERTKIIKTNFQNRKLVEELCQKCDFRKKVFDER